MKILDLSAVTTTVRFPFKEGSVKFLQDSYKEGIAAAILGIIGDTYSSTTPYRIYGADIHDDGADNWGTTYGIIFFNGEFYEIDAVAYSPGTFMNVFGLSVITTQYTTNADPVTFSDSVARNVHNIRKLHFVDGSSFINSVPINTQLVGLTSAVSTAQANIVSIFASISNYVSLNRTTTSSLTIKFDKNRVDFSDQQSPPAGTVTYIYDFTGAIPGCKYRHFRGLDQSGNTFVFPTNYVTAVTLFDVGMTTFSYGSATEITASFEFEYLGLDIYNNKVVKVSLATDGLI